MKLLTRQIRFWMAIGVTLVSIFLALRGINFAQVKETLAQTNPALALVALGTVVATTMAKAARWRLYFEPHHQQLRYDKLLAITFIGQMVNFVAFARLGELIRAYLLGEIEGTSKALALGTIVLEKLTNLVVLLMCFFVILPFMPLPHWLRGPGLAFAVMTIGLLLVTSVLGHLKDRQLAISRRWVRALPKLIQTSLFPRVSQALGSLDILNHRDISLNIGKWSLVVLLLATATNYVTFLTLGLNLPFTAAVFLLLVLQIGVAVPSLPGRLGPMQYLCVLSLSVFSVDRNVALSYGLLLYLIVYLPPICIGTFFLWREKLSLRTVSGAALAAQASPGGSD